RKRVRPKVEESWIAESCTFPGDVFRSTIKACKDNLPGLKADERRSLGKLLNVWEQKLNSTNRLPDSNCRKLTPPRPRKRRCIAKPVAPPKAEKKPLPRVEHVHNVEDNVIVLNRIVLPPFAPSYQPRYFHVIMPAFVLKRRILDSFLNLDILKRLIASNDQEATAILQKLVDDVLKLKKC
ncbi:hypothetical protein KR074_008688, partial [Drosophila pseudoananassae]